MLEHPYNLKYVETRDNLVATRYAGVLGNQQERSEIKSLPKSSETTRRTLLRSDDIVRTAAKAAEPSRNVWPSQDVTKLLPAGAPMYYDLDLAA